MLDFQTFSRITQKKEYKYNCHITFGYVAFRCPLLHLQALQGSNCLIYWSGFRHELRRLGWFQTAEKSVSAMTKVTKRTTYLRGGSEL